MTRRKIHLRVVGRFDLASQRPQVATVSIDRDASLFGVRPLRRRRVYLLPLALVAELVCERAMKLALTARPSEAGRRRNRRRASRSTARLRNGLR